MYEDLKFTDKKPKYMQLCDYLKDMISEGMYQKNVKLPSTRELARELNISRNTVERSYEILEADGYINIVKGIGVFVNDKRLETDNWFINWDDRLSFYAKEAERLDIVKHEAKWEKGMISFKSIAPDDKLFDMEDVKRSVQEVISKESGKILNYGYAQGYKPLIDYLKSYMSEKGAHMSDMEILITNGFTEGFGIVLDALTNEGSKVLCENPTHNTALKLMKLKGIDIVGIKMDDDGIDLNSLEETLKKVKVDYMYIIPSYHNPTGIVTPPEKRLKIYNMLKYYNIPIIEDGFNEELKHMSSHISPIMALSGGNGVIYIGSLSKILFPGLRIGWIAADKKLISYLESIKRCKNIHTSTLDQAVLYEFLKSESYEKYIRKIRKFYREKYEFAITCAKKYIPFKKIYGEGGTYILVETEADARNLLSKCIERGVIFTPGDIFYTNDMGSNAFRLGFSRVDKNDIAKGFKIIGEEIVKLMERRL